MHIAVFFQTIYVFYYLCLPEYLVVHSIMFQMILCQTIDFSLALMLMFDISGIEIYVTENTSKTLNSLIRRLKSCYRIIHRLILITWLMAVYLHRLPLLSMQNSSTLTTIYAMQISFQSLPMDLILSGTLLFRDDDFKQVHPEIYVKNPTLRMRINQYVCCQT